MRRVVALVTHFNRPHLIGDAVGSLLAQTRLPDHIVVMDDCSDSIPLDAIPNHPLVSVYRSTQNVGPFRLIEWGVRQFEADWYMIQDSDDISQPTRLERLLGAADEHHADMVGAAFHDVTGDPATDRIMSRPQDGTAEHLAPDGRLWVCTFGASIFSRDLWRRIGGFATGLRFGADVEFTSRACHVGKVVNIESVELIRRLQPDSLTAAARTGLNSPARRALRTLLIEAAEARKAARREGRTVDLSPFSTAPEIRMELVRGAARQN